MEALVLIIVTAMMAYVCFWSIRNDELYNARKKKERYAIGGVEEPQDE